MKRYILFCMLTCAVLVPAMAKLKNKDAGLVGGDSTMASSVTTGSRAISSLNLINTNQPSVDSIPSQVLCTGGQTLAITFTGPLAGTTFAWTNDAPSIGLAATGSGNIPAFTGTNNGTGPAVATITVTPWLNGTSGIPKTFTITVNPVPAVFSITGGGAYCSGTAGSAVGLSGSQTNINYQLKINGIDAGAPVPGTGTALGFGMQPALGTYIVIATAEGNCSATMNGSVVVASVNCSVDISDPCVCKNNATTLSNGQFDETIKVNAPNNQTWTVSAVTGLYLPSSPAPPAAPLPIAVGTAMTNIGGNMFELTGIHVDALGYTVSVTNGIGTTLTIGNTCAYPNPVITSNLPAELCLYSDVVILTGTPGDTNIVGQGFTVNGLPATQFDPGAGLGQYLITYTVDGGLPKASGPNDPGCTQSVSQVVNVIATPSQLTCNNLVNVSLDIDCVNEILPDDILEGSYGCYDDYMVELDKTPPFGNGPWVPAIVTVSDVGNTYKARVTHLGSGNTCVGNVKIEDKLAPTITCSDITLSCVITTYDPAYLLNVLGINNANPVVSDCSAFTLTRVDTWHDLACNQGFNGHPDLSAYVERKWTAKDAWNNISTCIQYIYFERRHIGDVLFPPEKTLLCSTGFIDTDPSVTGAPYFHDFGQDVSFYPNATWCEMQASYSDQILNVCDGTYKILRTWTVFDFCLPTSPFPPTINPLYYIQLIKIVDDQGPQFICPANLTVSTNPFSCCVTENLPDAIIRDNCSRINNISAMVIVHDQYTGNQTAMYSVGGTLTTFPGNNGWDLDTLGNWGTTPCLPQGTHTVIYTAADDCGNTTTCSFQLTVRDYVPPVAACDQFTTVAINFDDPFDCYTPADGCDGAGVTWVKATTFDDGSFDNCNNVRLTVRRMEPYSDCILGLDDCEQPTATAESDSIKFYCCEVGTTQTVILRAYQVDFYGDFINGPDGTPVYNECMVNVEVQDKIKPVCLPPAHVTVSCENFDPSLWGYGIPTVADNCCLDTGKVYQGQCGLTHTANYSLFDTVCNKGTIVRTFRAFDCHGQSSQCTQRIVVQYNQNYFVKFPNDVIITSCDGTGNYGEPAFFGKDCELLGVNFEDQVFTVVPDACFKIERTWSIINWCTYNPNLPCIEVPNPNPNAIANHPSNLPGPTVSACGTLPPWAPTIVKINPTDPSATNFCTFWDANANCYKYKQIIKIIDTQDPEVMNCPASPVSFCDLTPNDPQLWNEAYWYDNLIAQHDLCEGLTDLSITATDACSGMNLNIQYLLFLDLDGDGSMETVINSATTGIAGLGWNNVNYNNAPNPNFTGGIPRAFDERAVPANQKWGFAIQQTMNGNNKTASVRWNTQQSQNAFVVPELPYGTHKIKWIVSDGCGNESVCEYNFVVKDCKAPTVVCTNGLTVNIMPNGMITLWASDFLQYGEDNCTPASLIRYGIRKSGIGTGFPFDANGNPALSVSFNCDELGTQLVELWAIDLAGNADYCETYVIVQDNFDNCPDIPGPSSKVAGQLATESADGLDEGHVDIAGSSNAVPSFTFMTMSDPQGKYNFNAIPLASNSTITPTKDDNPLNGVTTYDLVLISKHILGLSLLNTPYRMIAADANRNNAITTTDIVELRKLVLGIYLELPNNTSWRFIDKSYQFPNPANPFIEPFPENKQIVNLLSDQLSEDFVSVKVGDANGNAIANATMPADDRSGGTLLFDLEDRDVKAGETFTVNFKAAEQVQGFQFTMNFDHLEVIDLAPGANLKLDNFGVFSDAITTSYNGNETGEFAVTFRALQSGKLRDMLGVSSRITKAEAYSDAAEKLDIAFRFKQGDVSTISGVGFELYQNQPNPFANKTYIGFHLPEATEATLTIFDETGRQLFTQKGSYSKGYNSILIHSEALGLSSANGGLLYYKLETASNAAVQKMIQTR